MVARHEAHHVAEVLSRVLTDEELRRHLEAGCAKVKRNLGWGEPVHQMERLYARCISPKGQGETEELDRKSTRLNSSHSQISYAVFCLKKKTDLLPRTA